jgi:hypothetical protein
LWLCSEGNDCTLKEVNSDTEEHHRANGRGGRRNHFRKHHGIRKSAVSEEDIEGSQPSVVDGEDVQGERPTRIFHLHRNAAKKTSSISADVCGEDVNKNEV